MITDLLNIFKENSLLYFLGFGTFILTLLVDIINVNSKKKEELKQFSFYFREFIYTFISILIGIVVCEIFEFSDAISKGITILCGLVGSTVIRKFLDKEEEVSDKIVDAAINKVVDKINSNIDTKCVHEKYDIINTINTADEIPLTEDGTIPSKNEYFQ